MVKIPWDDEARVLVKTLRTIGKKEGFRVRVRGSGPRAPQNRADGLDLRTFDQSLPLEYATHVRIYLNSAKEEGEGWIGSGWIGQDWQTQAKAK